MKRFLTLFTFFSCLLGFSSSGAAEYRTWGTHDNQKSSFKYGSMYFALKGLYSDISVENIENSSLNAWGWPNVPPSKTEGGDTVYGGSVSFGYSWNTSGAKQKGVRTELEIAFREDFEHDSTPTYIGAATDTFIESTVTSKSYLLNLYYDLSTAKDFMPYLGAGVGMTTNRARLTLYDPLGTGLIYGPSYTDTHAFSWAVTAGFAYRLTTHFLVDASFRYIDLGEIEWGLDDQSGFTVSGSAPGVFESYLKSEDVTANEIAIGARLMF